LVIHIFKEYWFDLYIGTIMFILTAVFIVTLFYFIVYSMENLYKLIRVFVTPSGSTSFFI
jgi:hypothetical protein